MKKLVLAGPIERRIYLIRGLRVMLDSDLAALYGVATSNLNKAVKRNKSRFPSDFMIRLSMHESRNLIFQIGISSFPAHGGRRKPSYAFSEQGIAMLSSVLRSRRAIQVNITIMRAFVKLRDMISAHKELAAKLAELERAVAGHDKHIQSLFGAIHRLTDPILTPKPPIGFRPD
ncbi:MAG TPA: ORF6N domain-containing protein [Elusimicrobiota bacterium]|nr:ORF6N domain-containing protein [Elusimicrobiota bacterium]